MSFKKNTNIIIFVLIAIIIFSSCKSQTKCKIPNCQCEICICIEKSENNTCINNNEILIGFNVELTGALAEYGQNCLNGANLAIKKINSSGGINGQKIKSMVLDNRSESSDAALAALRFGETKGLSAVIGPTNSNLVKSALSANNEIPMIIPSATANILLPSNVKNNNLYRICYTDQIQGEAMANYALDIGLKNVIVLTESSSDYSRGMSESFINTINNNGGKIVAHEYYSTGEMDFYNILTRLSDKGFDSIFIPGYYIEAGLIIRQMNELKIDAAVLSGDAFDSPALEEIIGNKDYLNNIYFTNHYLPNDKNNSDFEDSYFKEYGVKPSAYAALGYDCVMIFAQSIKDLDNITPQNISQNLNEINDFSGVTGEISMDEDHNAQKQVFVTQIKDGARIAAEKGE